MKTICGVIVLCVLMLGATTSEATRTERSLKFFFDDKPIDAASFAASSCESVNSNCRSKVAVSSHAYFQAVYKISKEIDVAFDKARRGGDAKAIALFFAHACASAYAELINSYVIKIEAGHGSKACAYAESGGKATATAIVEAFGAAFAAAENEYANAAAVCIARTVSVATATIVQEISKSTCITHGHVYINEHKKKAVFVNAVAKSFGIVLAAVRRDDAKAASLCFAYADSSIFHLRG